MSDQWRSPHCFLCLDCEAQFMVMAGGYGDADVKHCHFCASWELLAPGESVVSEAAAAAVFGGGQ